MTSKILASSREITLLSSKALRDLVEDTWQEYLGLSPQEEEIEGGKLQGSNFLLRAFLFLSTNHFHSHFIGENRTWPSCTEVWEMSLTGQMYPNLNSIVTQERDGGFWWKPRHLCQQILDSFVSTVQALKFSFNK